jgi:hypothetical protein
LLPRRRTALDFAMSGGADSLPYVPLVEYNGTTSTGGDSLTQDLNVFVSINIG